MNTLENIFNSLEWVAKDYLFSRPILDNKPYQMVKEDKKTTIIFNALGIKKEDIKISINQEGRNSYLTISGETKNEVLNRNCSVSGNFLVNLDSIDHIDYDTHDGLLVIEIYFKQAEKIKVQINRK